MGLSPIAPGDPDYVKNPSGIEGNYYGNQMVTKAIPEEGNRYTDRFPEEGPVTARIPEDGPSQQYTTMMVGEEGNPYTLRMPEEGPIPINPPTGGTGGCPAGYAPSSSQQSSSQPPYEFYVGDTQYKVGSGLGGGGGGLPDWGAAHRAEIFGTQFNPVSPTAPNTWSGTQKEYTGMLNQLGIG